mgnify:CR=1 FL=1
MILPCKLRLIECEMLVNLGIVQFGGFAAVISLNAGLK